MAASERAKKILLEGQGGVRSPASAITAEAAVPAERRVSAAPDQSALKLRAECRLKRILRFAHGAALGCERLVVNKRVAEIDEESRGLSRP